MATPSVNTPDFTDTVDQSFFIEPLGGPQNPQNYLNRFPEEVYNKTVDSHLVKLLYSLLGPAGIGWLRKNYLDARLMLEEYGVETFDLDAFYGNPLRFGRILEEVYDQDPRGALDHATWEVIRAKDAAYRSRALDYVRGMRLGNTPNGMRLVARSGLGHEVEIVEHYKWLYDQYTDDPLGIDRYGETNSTEEMVVLPRRELAQSEMQRITINGTVTGGFFRVGFVQYETSDIPNGAIDREALRALLEAIPTIGVGSVATRGGPLPGTPIDVYFRGDMANRDVPQLQTVNSLTGDGVGIIVETIRGGVEVLDELASISPRDQRHLMVATEFLKPQTTLMTFRPSRGITSRAIWSAITSTSNYTEVVRYAIGNLGVPWPRNTGNFWVEGGIEHEGHRVRNDLQHHYTGFHNVSQASAYHETALAHPQYNNNLSLVLAELWPDEHVGAYTNYQQSLYPYLRSGDGQNIAEYAMADYAEPLTVTTQDENGDQFINGIYPIEYQDLPGVPPIRYKHEQFWGSTERELGDDYLEFDLGGVKAVNFLQFEASRKPYSIEVAYDILDQAPERQFVTITPSNTLPGNFTVGYSPAFLNPWERITINFTDGLGALIFTRFIRIKFARRDDRNSPFVARDGTRKPYSIEIRNLRVGRISA